MRQDFFTYLPQFKLTIIGNHRPVLKNVDDAARRRFNIVPFILKPAAPDKQLEQKLKAEWPGILRWMIDGCLSWQTEGLVRPPSIVAATEDYFADQDLFALWLDDSCDVDPGIWDKSADLYASWSKYAMEAGEPEGTGRAFAENLKRRGFNINGLPPHAGSLAYGLKSSSRNTRCESRAWLSDRVLLPGVGRQRSLSPSLPGLRQGSSVSVFFRSTSVLGAPAQMKSPA